MDASEGGAAAPGLSAADLARLPTRLQWEVFGAYLSAGALAAAAETLDRLSAHGEVTPLHLRAAERLALAQGRLDDAVAAARRRATGFPSPGHQAELVAALLQAGQVAAAAQAAETALARAPASAELWATQAAVALAQGDYPAARTAAQRALSLDGDQPLARRVTARLAWAEGRRVVALAELERLRAGLAWQTLPPARLADLAEPLADLAEEFERPTVAADLRARVADLRQRRRAATWRAVAAALAEADAVPGRDQTAPRQMALPAGPAPAPAAAAEPVVGAVAPEAAASVALPPAVLDIVREQFGHAGLRPGQAEVIAQALAGVDTLATMPTGAGKSLCYQVAALALPGTAVVVSPLIALMKDQVDALPPAVATVSTLINSTLDPDELRQRLAALRAGQYKLVYVAPERLRQGGFLRALRAAGVSLFVVDEAHCVSLWGHDFRPDYLFIPRAIAALGNPPLLAMTATATPVLAADIERQMRRPLRRVRTSVFRPNLHYEVHHLRNREEKLQRLVRLCQAQPGPGIVYVSSRRDCEELATLLRREGVPAGRYHAGLERDERAAVQDDFMAGRPRMIVATVAFGMGIDKRDVRTIIHFSPARSLEAYAQESGRAGRDGRPARCVILYTNADKTNLARWMRSDEVPPARLEGLYAALVARQQQSGSRWLILNPTPLLPPSDDPDEETDSRVAVAMLERAGLLHRHPDAPREISLRWRRPLDDAAAADPVLGRLAALVDAREYEGLATWTTPRLADALDLAPSELEQRLSDWAEAGHLVFLARDRDVCLEVLPTPPDATRRLRALLAETRAENARRVEQMIAYLEARACRHVVLAAHFGERLPACADACDVCQARQGRRARPAAAAAPAARTVAGVTAADALTVLAAVRALPFPLGKTGLVNLLVGSIKSPIKAERSKQHGALAHLSAHRVGGLIDRLIAAGYLDRDNEHEYRLLSITDQGRRADEAVLAGLAEPPVPAPSAGAGRAAGAARADAGAEVSMEEWDAQQHLLFERLRQWRQRQAATEAMPPYIIMPNATLIQIVAARPRTAAALARIKGFGPARLERYGDEVLALLRAPDPAAE